MKEVIGVWLFSQILIIPFIIVDDNRKFALFFDFLMLGLMILSVFGLRLIGV